MLVHTVRLRRSNRILVSRHSPPSSTTALGAINKERPQDAANVGRSSQPGLSKSATLLSQLFRRFKNKKGETVMDKAGGQVQFSDIKRSFGTMPGAVQISLIAPCLKCSHYALELVDSWWQCRSAC